MEEVRPRRGRSPGRPLGSASVAADFGADSEMSQASVKALFDALGQASAAEVAAARSRWISVFRATFGTDDRRLGAGLDGLIAAFPAAGGDRDPPGFLLALQTYYVLVVKLLVQQVIATAQGSEMPTGAIRSAAGGGCLLERMRSLESDDCGGLGGGSTGPGSGDPFAWYLGAWSEAIDRSLRRLASVWQEYDFRSAIDAPHEAGDLLKTLYQEVFPKKLRHVLGEYYTPDWLAEQMLDAVGYPGESAGRLLDPACGSGAFLVAAIRRLRAAWSDRHDTREASREALRQAILSGVAGIDLNPLAVITARASYLIAMADLMPPAGRVGMPVLVGDSILGRHDGLGDLAGQVDFVVGNPPWIAWDNLPPQDREATKPLWQHYGLFTLSGRDARHGGGKKDLAMLMIYAAADRYLKPRGRLAMVVPQTAFQTRGAGDGFRRFRLGEAGEWLRVVAVDDLVDLRPFPGAANWTATIVLEKGARTTYPLPYVRYSADRSRRELEAMPIDPTRPTSPWFLWPKGWSRAASDLIGPSDYEAHLGANTAGANGVYWVTLASDLSPFPDTAPGLVRVRNIPERGKHRLPAVERPVESELLYPLLRWADVDRFRAVPTAFLLLAQDPFTRRGIAEPLMYQRYPNAVAYLEQFREALQRRAAYRRYQSQAPFYSMYDVGPYTLAPIKVVWRRMDRRINAAVVESVAHPRLGLRPVIPQETCVLVAADSADEAHYLCAVLNSPLVGFLVASHSVRGGKGFGSPGMLEFLRIRRYDPGNPIHRELAFASREAHRAAVSGDDASDTQDRIDRLTVQLWGLGDGRSSLSFSPEPAATGKVGRAPSPLAPG